RHHFVSEPRDLVQLRRTTRGKVKTRTGRSVTRKVKERVPQNLGPQAAGWGDHVDGIREQLRRFNDVNHRHHIGYRSADGRWNALHPTLVAIYNSDFDHGGRLYTARGGHQGLGKAERATILFDGRPSVELDYGGLH